MMVSYRVVDLTKLTDVLSLPLAACLSCAAASIFIQLCLKAAVHISVARFFPGVLGHPVPQQPCGIYPLWCLFVNTFIISSQHVSKPIFLFL